MSWRVTQDVEEFAHVAGALLAADPVAHNIALTVVETTRALADGTTFAWWTGQDGQVTGAVSHTPPFAWLLSEVPESAKRPLVELLAASGAEALNARTELVVELAALLARRTGRRAVLRQAERLHRLAALTPPPAPPGRPRLAGPEDESLLRDWAGRFQTEAGLVPRDLTAMVRERLGRKGFVLWEDAGQPVAMAGRTVAAGGIVRLGPVYTPPEHRRHGYAGAATVAAAREALAEAGTVVLHTDLTNATSNGLYARLGFVAVHDRAVFTMADPAG